MGTKGNDGKGARKVLMQRIASTLLPFLIIIGIVKLVRTSTSISSSGSNSKLSMLKGKHISHRVDGLRKEMHEMHDRHALMDEDVEKLLRKTPETLTYEDKVKLITSGAVNLVNVHVSRKPKGVFCRVNWEAHKYDPASTPMFRDLLSKSPHCTHSQFDFDINSALEIITKYDEENRGPGITLEPKGFVFHESRCGSTLVANSLAAFNPEQSRVYSESPPPIAALQSCGDGFKKCGVDDAAKLFKQVITLMGRTDNPNELYLFFKIQSIGSKFIKVMNNVYPEVPWIFVYRNPVEVMMSHLSVDVHHANCLRSMKFPADDYKKMIWTKGVSVKDLTPEEHCAIHLATLCKKALDASSASGKGRFVNYENLPDILIDDIIPDHFQVSLTPDEETNIRKVSSTYSKGSHHRNKEWKEDSEEKQNNASPAVIEASDKWLLELYDEIGHITY